MSVSIDPLEKSLLTGQWTDQALSNVADVPLAEWFTNLAVKAQQSKDQEYLRLILAVALLHAFLQVNWTGPNLDVRPLDILVIPETLKSEISEDVLHAKSITELASSGEPAYHLAEIPIFLRLAELCLGTSFTHLQSAAWWRLRVWSIHEHVLDEPVAPPSDLLPTLAPYEQLTDAEPDLVGSLLLEEGLLDHQLSQDRQAAELFVRAASAAQLEYELTGALGKRTKFQQHNITQLVLLAESRHRDNDTPSKQPATLSSALKPTPETLALNDDTLLEQTQFTSSSPAAASSRLTHIDPSKQPPLHPLDQCIFLAMCLNIKNTSPVNGLTSEQMSPYVARVIEHPRNWSVHTMALLLRSRLEAHRTRTVERSTLQLQALVDQMPTADSSVTERLLYIHALPLPSKWEMQRELALRFLSIGVVRSALEIFERLEMWEEVVKCWQSMEQKDKGIAIVRDLLEGKKAEADLVIARGKASSDTRKQKLDAAREAKLWALLGDLEPEHALEHYNRAWEVSKETSGRAMRSLGGYYFAQGDYPHAIECLRKAVKINPLYSRSWFILGCAHVRQEEWEGARDAFTRCVGIDDEDGESWNNLASVYLRLGEAGRRVSSSVAADGTEEVESGRVPFSNKVLAFRALKQGLKSKRDNWQMWTNYMIVAMDVGELAEACRALARVVEQRAAKDGAACVDAEVLERLVDAATRGEAEQAATGGDSAATVQNPRFGLLRQVMDLLDRVILPRVSSGRIFRAKARLLTSQGLWEEAIQMYLNAYRNSSAGTIEKDEADVQKWKEAVDEVEEIVDVLRNFGTRVESSKWRSQARSIVRTFMGRTKDFEDEPDWSRLVQLQEDLRQEDRV
ncbi:tetratricopeptide repeat domain 27 [Irpex rosettiformis]|uniref:Tetratricopeptide repeat domain 27 n=1 Tax=Irpex rosettiformis TaxID=378272 RepID=A0ACB8UCH2_9APHY|nr:tetratricopeptide repeat domain 27 [Irpex rosettiformis]